MKGFFHLQLSASQEREKAKQKARRSWRKNVKSKLYQSLSGAGSWNLGLSFSAMASPSSGRLSITPSSRVLQSPLSDESIWKRLKEAGLDEESIKRRDKAALIAYIAKLETEVRSYPLEYGFLFVVLIFVSFLCCLN